MVLLVGGKCVKVNIMGTSDNIIATERRTTNSKVPRVYYFYNKDLRASTTSIVAESGAAVKAYKYDEFGNTESFGNLDNEIAYTGGIYDKSTQLYYLNARYYNPEDGRFITQDSYRGSKEDMGTWHLYAYCGNNPVNYVDPSGHAAFGKVGVVATRYPKGCGLIISYCLWVENNLLNVPISSAYYPRIAIYKDNSVTWVK
ncbi:MAG: RHS repeat-associated core domain-containing protein [Anaerovoracaceae bacterium]